MASASAVLERRRASRLRMRIPVKVFGSAEDGQLLDTLAEAVAISRYGALIRVPHSLPLGMRVEILHGISQETREFRVVRVSEPQSDGFFELGVEILYPGRHFWGVPFPGERHSA